MNTSSGKFVLPGTRTFSCLFLSSKIFKVKQKEKISEPADMHSDPCPNECTGCVTLSRYLTSLSLLPCL